MKITGEVLTTNAANLEYIHPISAQDIHQIVETVTWRGGI
jgi:hypothetical protein